MRFENILSDNDNDNDNDNENNFYCHEVTFSFIVQEQQHTQQRLFFTCQENILYNAQGKKWL